MAPGIDQFLRQLHARELNFLASDLIKEGIEPRNIVVAIKDAIEMAGVGGLQAERHFSPVYTFDKGVIYKDCKLSKLGWHLVLLNLPGQDKATSTLKLSICEQLVNYSHNR